MDTPIEHSFVNPEKRKEEQALIEQNAERLRSLISQYSQDTDIEVWFRRDTGDIIPDFPEGQEEVLPLHIARTEHGSIVNPQYPADLPPETLALLQATFSAINNPVLARKAQRSYESMVEKKEYKIKLSDVSNFDELKLYLQHIKYVRGSRHTYSSTSLIQLIDALIASPTSVQLLRSITNGQPDDPDTHIRTKVKELLRIQDLKKSHSN